MGVAVDFVKLLKSFEEFVFEVISWFLFYPLTLWNVMVRPLAMMQYAADELDDAEDDYYSDRLSPPIFLAITLGLSHLIELALDVTAQMPGILAGDENLLGYRVLMFSIFPLVFAVRLMRKQRVPLDRKTLRAPFYAQSYAIAPYALVVGVGPLLVAHYMKPSLAALAVLLGSLAAASIWYVILQTRWYRAQLDCSLAAAIRHACVSFVLALIVVGTISGIVSKL